MQLKLILALAAGIAACSPALADDDRSNMTVIQSDEHTVEVRGPISANLPFAPRVGNETYMKWFLRSFVDKHTHVARHQLYVTAIFATGEGGDFRTAHTDDGQPLSVVVIDEHDQCMENDCRFSTTLAVELPETLLRDRTQTGFQVRMVSGPGRPGFGSELHLVVSPEMIQQQLTALAEAEKME